MDDLKKNAEAIVERLNAEYQRSVTTLRRDLDAFLTDRTAPDLAARAQGSGASSRPTTRRAPAA